MRESVTRIYQSFVWRGENSALASDLYGNPPVTLGDIITRRGSLIQKYRSHRLSSEDRTSKLAGVLITLNRVLGVLTPEVKKSIEGLWDGAVEAAHQSVCLGGSTYILNKAATARRIASVSGEDDQKLSAFFFVADYDQVQPELTNIRTPLLGPEGNLVSMPVPTGYENSPVSIVPLASFDWYAQVEENIRSGYRPLFKSVHDASRALFEERLEHALSICRSAFVRSETLGEWAQRIIGHLLNIDGRLGVPLLPASDSQVRPLFLDGLEFLLAGDNLKLFIEEHQRATDTILQSGFEPGGGVREQDYVPFFYECPESECHQSRVELHHASTGLLKGKCPQCHQTVEIEFNEKAPDLSEQFQHLSPRVDTRQILVDTLLPVVCHVGGPGEAAYYSQVIPSARRLGLPFPMFVKYPRVYFNTPWNESLALRLKERGFPVLHSPEVFRLSGQVARARKSNKTTEMNAALENLEQAILGPRKEIMSRLSQMPKSKGQADGEDAQKVRFDLECYLSWAYGGYAEEKLGQEASWSWIEWMLNTGPSDLFGPYERAYVGGMKNGATLFVNFVA